MTSAHTSSHLRPFRHHLLDRPAVVHDGRLPYVLTVGLAVATLAAAVPSLFFPHLLSGTDVLTGNLRGTALVMLVLGLPLLAAGAVRTARNSARWLVVWMGATAYLTYQGVMLLFATPYNTLFLAYVAVLGFGIWTSVALITRAMPHGFAARVDHRMPTRFVAGTLVAFAVLNAVGWLARIVPTIGSDDPASVLDGSGLLTSPGWVQDLAFWIPASIVAGVLMWRGRHSGLLLSGAMLLFFLVESISVASDQWWGVRADDTQPEWASMTAVPLFVAVAALTAVPLGWYLRNVDRH